MSLSKWSTRDPNLTVEGVLKRLNIDPLEVPMQNTYRVNEEDTPYKYINPEFRMLIKMV
jgi:hypothetical protein